MRPPTSSSLGASSTASLAYTQKMEIFSCVECKCMPAAVRNSGASPSRALIDVGVVVRTGAWATLSECYVSNPEYYGVAFTQGGTGRVERCTMVDSHIGEGVFIHGAGSNAEVSHCTMLRNRSNGVFAVDDGCLTANMCTPSDNMRSGYFVQGAGSVMELTECTSTGDVMGCMVRNGAKLTAHKVHVSESKCNGFEAHSWAGPVEAMLWGCTATKCEEHAVHARTSGVHVEGCSFHQNGGCGALTTSKAVIFMQGCCSSQNMGEGYSAEFGAKVLVTSSFSDGDKSGCMASEFGELTMDEVTVDGVCQSGTLHQPPLLSHAPSCAGVQSEIWCLLCML